MQFGARTADLGTFDQGTVILIGVGIAFVLALLVFGALLLLSRLRQEIALMRRVGKISPKKDDMAILQGPSGNIIRRQRSNSLDNLLGKYLPTFDGMRRRFRQAGMRVSLAAYVAAVLVLTAGGTAFVMLKMTFLALPPAVIPIPVAVMSHLFLSNTLLGWKIAKRKSKVVEQMPLALDFITRSLKVGQPIDTALREVVKECDPPLKEEVETIVGQLGIGTPLDRALRGVANDLEIREFDFFAIATIVQIESGGNLAEALRGLSETIRQRHAMRMKVEALAAEGKASAIVLSSLPILLLLYFRTANGEYVEPLFSDPRGNMVLFVAFFFIFIGALIMRKIVRIKI
jgi:tight adherence protein B